MGTFYNKSSFGFWGLHCTMKTNVKVNPIEKKKIWYWSSDLPINPPALCRHSDTFLHLKPFRNIFFNINYWLKFNRHFSNTCGIYPQLMQLLQAKEGKLLHVPPRLQSEFIFTSCQKSKDKYTSCVFNSLTCVWID